MWKFRTNFSVGIKGELYPKIELFLSKWYEKTIFKRFFSYVALRDFYKKSSNIAILQILPLKTAAHICCVSGCFKSLWVVCGVVYEEERSWSGVNRNIYGAKPYQFEPTYLPLSTERRTSAKWERSASILRHKFQKHPYLLTIVVSCFVPHNLCLLYDEVLRRHLTQLHAQVQTQFGQHNRTEFTGRTALKQSLWKAEITNFNCCGHHPQIPTAPNKATRKIVKKRKTKKKSSALRNKEKLNDVLLLIWISK